MDDRRRHIGENAGAPGLIGIGRDVAPACHPDSRPARELPTPRSPQRFGTSLHVPYAYTVLHAGTHFSLRPGNAMRSFLVLGDGSRLMLDQLADLDFTDLELGTLPACQTAMGGGQTDDGRAVEGLSTIAQQRGARQVVASLWRVHCGRRRVACGRR